MNQLKILQKTYDMVLYAHVCLRQFPKSEKYALAKDIKESLYRLLRLTVTANKRYYKKTTLQDIDIELDTLRIFIRLASDSELRYLSLQRYERLSMMLNEIGKMLGGWIKSAKQSLGHGPHRLPNRGGSWNNTSNAGLFYLNLNNPRSNSNTNIGFRSALPSRQKWHAHGRASSAEDKGVHVLSQCGKTYNRRVSRQ